LNINMLSWLWGGGGAAPPPPPVSPALREAQEQLSSRARAPLNDDRALATACGFDGDSTLARHLGAAVRGYGEQEDDKSPTIAADSVVVAFQGASSHRHQFASAVLQGGCSTADSIPLDQVEAVLRDCLRLVEAPGEADDSAGLARALALGLASPGDLGGGSSSSSDSNPASSSSHVTRDAIERWAKQRAGVAIADFLSALMRRLGGEDDGPPKKAAALWPYPPPRLLLPSPSPPSNPLLLSPRAALLLAPHVTDPRRRERWRLVFSASLHGKSWSTLQGRLAAAGASSAANVEAHADAAALSAFNAAAGGGGGTGGVGGGGRAARAAAAAAAAAAASGSRSAAANPDDDDEAAGWSGPPATLVLARDADSGAVFGGATSVAWRKKPDFYGGGGGSSAFLFALSPRFRLHPLSGINDRVQYLGAGFQSRPNGLGMGGQLGAFGLWLDAMLERGHSRPNATYACASLLPAGGDSGAQEFGVADVEVWAMLTPEEDEGPSSLAKGAAAAAGATNRGSVLNAEAERNFLAVAGKFSDHSAGVRD
jgi:hypothetical protein